MMKDFSNDPDFQDLVAAWHENREFPEARREELQKRLDADPELRRALAREAQTDALARTVQQGESRWLKLEERLSPETVASVSDEDAVMARIERSRPSPKINRLWSLPLAAAIAVLLAVFLWPRQPEDQTFATLKQTRAALWKSGDLQTADGSRLGEGTLRLVEGLATLRFDSGAEVTLEAPATLILRDKMNCELRKGTVVSDIPDSALGFRIKTPSADVVDYGTRFAVSVHEGTGETHTHVMEGRVQVEYAASDRVVELKTGQRNTVAGETLGEATDETEPEPRTLPVSQLNYGPDWLLLETSKDAYTGIVKDHTSDILLYVKKAPPNSRVNRVSYLGFDLDGVDPNLIEEAELLLHFAPTGWGLASHLPDASFSVYGLVGEVPEWDESIMNGRFPGQPEEIRLGSFMVPQGVQKGRFQVRSDALKDFLLERAGSEITLKVVRDTKATETGTLVHGFASRRHPILPAPTLAIRHSGR